MNAPKRFVRVAVSSLLVARIAVAQDAVPEPPPAPPPAPTEAPAPTEPPPAPTEPPPAPSEPPPVAFPPPAEQPAPPPAEPAPPLLAPLPPASSEPPSAAFPPPARHPPPAPPSAPTPTERAEARRPSPDHPAADEKQAEKPPAEDDSVSKDGLFGPFRIGPLIGGGLPSLLSFGGEIRLTRFFGAGVRFGLIPAVHFAYYGEATVSYQDYGAYADVHPFGGGFLLGAELGYALVTGTYQSQIDTAKLALVGLPTSIDITSNGSVETLVLTPEIGYLFTWRAGFTFGFDAGAQIPVASSHVSLSDHISAGMLPAALVNEYVAPDREKVQKTLGKVGQTVLPAFHLRIGWLL